MKKLMFVLALLLVFPAAYAKDKDEKPGPKIQQVFVNFDDDYVVILGQDFLYDCEVPVLMIDGFPDPLVLDEPLHDFEVTAKLPDLPDGNYSLAITCNKETDRFDFAIGAIGPVGPIGPTGEQGPIGLTGANGKDGTDGKDGANGAAGPRGPEGPEGPEGPAGQADFEVYENSTGICNPYEYIVKQEWGSCPENQDNRIAGTGYLHLDFSHTRNHWVLGELKQNCVYSKSEWYVAGLHILTEYDSGPINLDLRAKCLRLKQ